MLTTELTQRFGLTVPVIGAPMAGVAHGRLAAAVSAAGGLGMLGVGSLTPGDWVAAECAVAGAGGAPYGVGLMTWVLPDRPELLEAVLAAEPRPALVSVSFGDPAPHVDALHAAGIAVAAQVNDVGDARRAADAGVDVVVAQGTEAGGHTGTVGTLPLLQLVLDAVTLPVVAAGGIATGRGLAAVLAAGGAGAWVGTALLAAPEAETGEPARARVLAASEADTVLTRVFDLAQRIPWPERYGGRALTNSFTRRWHGAEDALVADLDAATAELRRGRAAHDPEVAYVYAGQAVGLVRESRPVADVLRAMAAEAETCLDRATRLRG